MTEGQLLIATFVNIGIAIGVIVVLWLMLETVMDAWKGIRQYKRDREFVEDLLERHPGNPASERARRAYNRRYPRRKL